MASRVCRDCPIPGCGAKYLVKLSNHLSGVHLLDCKERRTFLQEAKLQPKVKVILYQDDKTSKALKSNTTDQKSEHRDVFYQKSTPKKGTQSLKSRKRKAAKTGKPLTWCRM
jgi:hypothetical protein